MCTQTRTWTNCNVYNIGIIISDTDGFIFSFILLSYFCYYFLIESKLFSPDSRILIFLVMEKISKNVQMSLFLGENIRVLNIIFYKLEVPTYLSEHSMNSKLGVQTLLLHSLIVNLGSNYYKNVWVWPSLSALLFWFFDFPGTDMEKRNAKQKLVSGTEPYQ